MKTLIRHKNGKKICLREEQAYAYLHGNVIMNCHKYNVKLVQKRKLYIRMVRQMAQQRGILREVDE